MVGKVSRLLPSYQEVFAVGICLVSSLRSQKLKVEFKASVGIHHGTVLRHRHTSLISFSQRHIFPQSCNIIARGTGERRKGARLTLLVVVVVLIAQAALVSHMKLAVQFWYIRNLGAMDCAAWITNGIHISRHTPGTLTRRAALHQTNSGDSPHFLWSRPGG